MAPRLLRILLLTYPPSLRSRYGSEMADAVEQQWRNRRRFMSRLGLAAELVTDSARSWRSQRRPSQKKPGGTSADVRDALRLFRRSPLFAAGAVLTLALGVGATTAILSLADAALFRPLPVPQPERLVEGTFSWSYPDFRKLADDGRAMGNVAAWSNGQFALERSSEINQVIGVGVSGNYFALAGQGAVAGRLIGASDEVPGAPPVAVISERLWERVFHRDPAAVGARVDVNRRAVTIVGVSPAAFRGLSLQNAPELFVPVSSIPDLTTGFLADPGLLANRDRVWLSVAGRMQDGVLPSEVDAEARAIYYRDRKPETADATPWFTALVPQAMGVATSGDLRTFMNILIGASALTLLLTCATVANLLLVRAERRRRELAVRTALGAGHLRIARLLLVESIGIGGAGAIAGVGVAVLALRLLGDFALPGQILISDLRVALSWQLLLLAGALGLATTIVVGVAPAVSAARTDLTGALRAGARATSRHPVRSTLVAVQVALCVLLLGGSIAFGRALDHALAFNFGFDVAHTSITTTNPALARFTPAEAQALHDQALARVRAQPSVQAAAWALMRPLSGGLRLQAKMIGETRPAGAPGTVQGNVVTDGYFETLAIPIVEGRSFTAADMRSADSVIIVSASLAKLYWPQGSAIGKRLSLLDRDDAKSTGALIVGVAADTRRAVGGPGVPMIYVPVNHVPPGFTPDYLFVRSSASPESMLLDVRAVLRGIDPNVPITTSATMASHVAAPLMAHRLGLTLFLMFAALALVLTTFGLYAIVATAVSQRTREIGIRVALGAEHSRIVGLVSRQGALPVGLGLAAGVAACLGSAKFIKSFMFELPAVSAGTLIAMLLTIGAVAVLAMVLPARRALAVDPAITLRSE